MGFRYASVPFIHLFLFTILNSFPDYSGIICKVLLGLHTRFTGMQATRRDTRVSSNQQRHVIRPNYGLHSLP